MMPASGINHIRRKTSVKGLPGADGLKQREAVSFGATPEQVGDRSALGNRQDVGAADLGWREVTAAGLHRL